jgi:hypothetical protein
MFWRYLRKTNTFTVLVSIVILSTEGIPEEINVHRKIFGNDPVEVDYDNIGSCPFCKGRIDRFN